MARLSRRDVIIASIAGFIAWLWTVHFLPSLRFVPHAFVAGVLLTVGGFIYVLLTTTSEPRSTIVDRLPASTFLGLTAETRWKQEITDLNKRKQYTPIKIYTASRSISHRIDELLDLILRDFVKSWYTKISSGSAFSDQIDRAIRSSLQSILARIFRLDLVEFGVTRLLPVINSHVRAYTEAERLVHGKRTDINTSDAKEVELAIAQRFRDGKLHPAASLSTSKTAVQQQQHLRRLIGKVLGLVLPANMHSSASVVTLVKEIVACAVLLPVMTLIADPDVLNQLIESYGRSIIHERKTMRKLRAALDEHASPGKKTVGSVKLPRLKRDDGERSFENFVKAIKGCYSLTDAKRYEHEISILVNRENTAKHRDVTHLKRLEIGRKLLEQRMQELAAGTNSGNDLSKISLRELLYDASGLAYFMEFMDGLNLLGLVQFWVVADAFRNNSTGASIPGNQRPARWVASDRDLLVQISGRYLWRPELQVPKGTEDAVNVFLNAGDAATYQQYSRARIAIIEHQDKVSAKMEAEQLKAFKASDLFRQWSGAPVISQPKPQINGLSSTSAAPGPVRDLRASSSPSKQPELRRAIASHSDLASAVKKNTKISEPRRSFDEANGKRPLFDDEGDYDPLARSNASLDSLDESQAHQANGKNQRQMVNAVQAALDEAMDEDSDDDFGGWGRDSLELPVESPFDSPVDPKNDSNTTEPMLIPGSDKPSLSSLGLVGTPSRRTVFSEGDMFGESETTLLAEDEGNETDNTNKTDDEDIREAAPGDLGLSELVQSLTLDIEKLEAQQKVVDSLMQKAELTNNPAELRILRKSKASLEREIHRKELQRQQYIVQKSENDLYGKAHVSIKSIMVGTETDGHEFALYVIEVTRHGSEKSPAVTWAITRRYSEFHDLHRRLRKRYPSIRDLDFPRRQVVLTLQKDFLKKRSTALERYLRDLLTRPQICRSLEFRAFLSQQTIRPVADNGQQVDKQDFITRIYSSVTDGMEEFIGNVPVLDQLSAAGQSLITAATSYNAISTTASPTLPQSPATDTENPRQAAEAQAEISAFENRADPETVTFIKPICDVFIEIFQLNQGNNWLRGRAVVVVTQQLLGGTIERRVRETFKTYTSETSICRYIDMLRDIMWPNGTLRTTAPERTEAEKEASRRNAAVVLQTLLPDLAGGVVGRGNASAAARRVHATLNNGALNRHLVYSLLDEVVEGVFGRVVR